MKNSINLFYSNTKVYYNNFPKNKDIYCKKFLFRLNILSKILIEHRKYT